MKVWNCFVKLQIDNKMCMVRFTVVLNGQLCVNPL